MACNNAEASQDALNITGTGNTLVCNELATKKRKLSENGTNNEVNGQNGNCIDSRPTCFQSKTDKHDAEYFSSYSDIELHRTMIEDTVRTNTYREAIMSEAGKWIKDKVVVDVGCGTGILSMFCAQAGAKKVYAIDASDISKCAKNLIDTNGFSDIITVIQGKAEEIELPEKVDAIVSEWMGYMLFYETMLPSVLHIRDTYLKPNGKMFPERAVLHMALAETPWITKYEESAFTFWISLTHVYNLDMSILAESAVQKYKDTVHVHMVGQEDVMSIPKVICDLDLYKISAEDLKEIKCEFSLASFGCRCLNSVVIWFDVWFPNGGCLSTSPYTEDTHWQNTVLSIQDRRLIQDDIVSGTIRITQNRVYYRHLVVELDYSINKQPSTIRSYQMDDNCIEE